LLTTATLAGARWRAVGGIRQRHANADAGHFLAMELFTIGFTKSTAERFFTRIADAGVKRVMDIRLNNSSQLAGFAKATDLPYFLRELVGANYVHEPLLAPTPELLAQAKRAGADWTFFEQQFRRLLRSRQIETTLARDTFGEPTVLLCSEATAEHCHRRLVAEYLQAEWSGLRVAHL
jgi:uncharacterized protein (DUF488 family)